MTQSLIKYLVSVLTSIMLMFFIASGQAMATSAIAKNKTITAITSYGHFAVISFDPPEVSEACPSEGSDHRVVIEFSDQNNPMFSMLLSAYIAKHSTVGFGVSDCRVGNGHNLPLIYRVDI